MKNYIIKSFSLEDQTLNANAVELVSLVFGKKFSINKLINNTNTNNKTQIIGAFLENKLVSINGFICHTLNFNGEKIYGFQSCWTATHPKHRGQSLFRKIIEESKIILAAQGDFILGYPNKVSEPIFVNKFGFKTFSVIKKNIFFFNLKKSINNFQYPLTKHSVNTDWHEGYNWKFNEFGDKIISQTINGTKIWGKIIEKRISIFKVRGFAVGDISLENGDELIQLLKNLRKIYNIHFFQFIAPEKSDIWSLINNPNENEFIEPLIIFPLNSFKIENLKFNFLNGQKDVF